MLTPPVASWNTPLGRPVSDWWAGQTALYPASGWELGMYTRLSEINRARLAELLHPQASAALGRYALNLVRAGAEKGDARQLAKQMAAPTLNKTWDTALAQVTRDNPVPLMYPEGANGGMSSYNPQAYGAAFEAQHPGVMRSLWTANPDPRWTSFVNAVGPTALFPLDEGFWAGIGLKGGAANRSVPVGDYFSSLFTDRKLPPGAVAAARRRAAPVSVEDVKQTPFSSLFSGMNSEDTPYEGRTG